MSPDQEANAGSESSAEPQARQEQSRSRRPGRGRRGRGRRRSHLREEHHEPLPPRETPPAETAPPPQEDAVRFEDLSGEPEIVPESESRQREPVEPEREPENPRSGREELPFLESASERPAEDVDSDIPFREPSRREPPVERPALPSQPPRHAPVTVQEAIDEVSDVIETLRQTLDDMEGVLELLESLERQTNVDEREIESLRRALRQFHRPPDRSQSQPQRGRR